MLYTWQFSVSFQSLILNVGVFLCTKMRECRRDFIRKLYKAPCRLELIFFNKRHLCFARIAYQNTSLVFQVDHHILRNSLVSIKQSYNNFLLAFSGFLNLHAATWPFGLESDHLPIAAAKCLRLRELFQSRHVLICSSIWAPF